MTPDIEALARHLATEMVEDWIYGEMWWGQFDPSDPVQYEAQVQNHMDYARERAKQYLRAAKVIE